MVGNSNCVCGVAVTDVREDIETLLVLEGIPLFGMLVLLVLMSELVDVMIVL